MDNPLLAPEGLPAFDRLHARAVEPAVDAVLAANRARLTTLAHQAAPDWDSLVTPLDDMAEALHRAFGPAAHLNAVCNTPELRAAYNACLPKLSAYETELGQHAGLYQCFQALAARADALQLDAVQRKILHDELRDFRLAGVHLPAEQKARFKAVQQRLAEQEAKFEEQVLDATDAWRLDIHDEARLAGIPAGDRARFAAQAKDAGVAGWRLTLDYPSYHAVITHADDRSLREQLYAAYSTRASDQGDARFDNTPVMRDILALRQEAATLLGFDSFAAYSLADKMADSPDDALAFLHRLAIAARPRAQQELAALQAFARAKLGIAELAAWDMAYASEKLREQKFALSQEALRPYFPAPQVLDGLFAVAEQLYGVRFTPLQSVSTWHAEVRVYELRDANDAACGILYTDLYARPRKRAGAWMDDCLTRRRRNGRWQHPAAYLVCNFAPPGSDRPALLNHDDVVTLFHEFGHCLHHLLTRVAYPGVAGINGVEWDAVELPSQFHENFAWQPAVLDRIARHHASGEPLPAELRDRLLASRRFHSGLHLVRQLEFALFDLELHRAGPTPDIGALLQTVRRQVAVAPVPAYNRFAHSFTHIFGGGYAAGYYSYLWAEVLAADAYTAFREPLDTAAGRRFLEEILTRGGSRPALESFRAYRGRDPDETALLHQYGLIEEDKACATAS